MIGGVCAGVAAYTGWDVTLVRLLTVIGVVFGFGSVAIAYIVAWILLPKA
jgi:phage shock protein PspC (stress-responsive transcriptional regulator)